jgi:hypothetical protein
MVAWQISGLSDETANALRPRSFYFMPPDNATDTGRPHSHSHNGNDSVNCGANVVLARRFISNRW